MDNNRLLRKRTYLPKETILYQLISAFGSFALANILFFFYHYEAATVLTVSLLTSILFFNVIIYFNNSTADGVEVTMGNLTATRNVNGVDVTAQFMEHLKNAFLDQGYRYAGQITGENLKKVDATKIFDSIFLDQTAEVISQFRQVDGNFFLFFQSLTSLQREQLLRYFIVNN